MAFLLRIAMIFNELINHFSTPGAPFARLFVIGQTKQVINNADNIYTSTSKKRNEEQINKNEPK